MLRLSRGLLLCSPAARRCWAQDLMDLIGGGRRRHSVWGRGAAFLQ